MRRLLKLSFLAGSLVLLLAGCGEITVRNPVPEDDRSTAAPTVESGGAVGLPGATPPLPSSIYPPSVIAHSPGAGEEVPVGASLTWTFDQLVDRRSFEDALSLYPSIEGSFTWSDSRNVTFVPTELAEGTRYVVTLSSDVKSVSGIATGREWTLAFSTLSPLHVTRTSPTDGEPDLPADVPILVEFSRPVVTKACVGVAAEAEGACFPLPLVFRPALTGSGSWVDTTTYRFQAQKGLAAGQRHEVTLEPPVTSVDGAILGEAVSWTFETATPRVVEMWPGRGAGDVRIDTGVWIVFSTPMERVISGEAFSLTRDDGEPIAGTVTWLNNGTTLAYTPTQKLDLETTYVVRLGERVRAVTSAPLANPLSWAFRTVPYPQFLYHTPDDQVTGFEIDSPVYLAFAGHMDEGSLLRGLRVSSEPSEGALSGWYDAEARVFSLNWSRDPRTEYCVSQQTEILDIYGNPLLDPVEFCFETGDLSPLFELAAQFEAVTLDAGRPAELRFGSRNTGSADFTLSSIDVSEMTRALTETSVLLREWTEVFDTTLNATEVVTVPLMSSGDSLLTGLYSLTWRLPGQEQTQGAVRIAVVDRHLLVKLSEEEVLVWITDLASGMPISRTAVEVVDRDALLVAGGTTDENGLARMPVNPRPDLWSHVAAITGEPGQEGYGFALTTWQGNASPWDYDIRFSPRPEARLRCFLDSDRTAYHAGDTVRFVGALRAVGPAQYELPEPGAAITVSLRDPLSSPIYTDTVQVSASGAFSGTFMLRPDAELGDYKLRTIAQGEADRAPTVVGSASFSVVGDASLPIEVVVTPENLRVVEGETVRYAIQAGYLSGGVLADAPLEWEISARPFSPSMAGAPVGVAGEDWSWAGAGTWVGPLVVAHGSGRTDAEGRYVVEAPADLGGVDRADTGSSQQWTLRVTIPDKSGLSVSGSAATVVHPTGFLLGLRPDALVYGTRQRASIDLLVADPDGRGIAAAAVTVRLSRRTWFPATDGGTEPYTDTVVAEEEVTVDRNGFGSVGFTLAEAGFHIVTAEAAGGAGHTATHELFLWVGGEGLAARLGDSSKLDIVADAESYSVGDVARVLVPVESSVPYQVLLTVERERVLSVQRYLIDVPNPVIDVPIVPGYGPNAFISAAVVLPGTADSPPRVRVGYVAFEVEPVERFLNVDISPDKLQYEPGDRATLRVRVTDAEGLPVDAEIHLELIDGSTALQQDVTRSTLPEVFYGARPLRVVTGDALLMFTAPHGGVSQTPVGASAADRSGLYGPGTGIDVVAGESSPANLRAMALWDNALRTNAEGEAALTVTLPDSQVTWIARAWALTPDTRVGEGETAIQVIKPLYVQPVTPLFLVDGDRTELATLIYNATAEELLVDVWIEGGDGLVLDAEANQQLMVPAGERRRVSWTALVNSGGAPSIALSFGARSGDLSDIRGAVGTSLGSGLLPVRHFVPRDVRRVAGIIEGAGSSIDMLTLPALSADAAFLTLSVDPSLTSTLISLISADPYPTALDSTEDWIDRLMELVSGYSLLGDTLPVGAAQPGIRAALANATDHLFSRQNPDGGWGWAEESKLPLTVYAMHGLLEAQKAGIPTRPRALDRGVAFIQEAIGHALEEGLRDPHLAFGLLVLSDAGADWPQGAGALLYADRQYLGVSGRAYLASALGAVDRSDTRVASLLEELRDTAVSTDSGTHWEALDRKSWITSVQATAAALETFLHLAPEDALIPNMVRWLMLSRGVDGWSTTYEDAWSISALAHYARLAQVGYAEYDWSVSLNDEVAVGSERTGSPGRVFDFGIARDAGETLRDGQNLIGISREEGAGSLYYAGVLGHMLPIAGNEEGVLRGIAVDRRYCAADAVPDLPGYPNLACEPVGPVYVGDEVAVQLLVTVPESRHFVKLEDPYPAGFVPLRLVESGLDADVGWESPGVSPSAFTRRILGQGSAFFFAEGLAPGTHRLSYRLRAAVPGEFYALPASAEESFFPEVWGRTSFGLLEVLPLSD